MSETWILGYGRYHGARYQVNDRHGAPVVTLIEGMVLGSGSSARQLIAEGGILVLPALVRPRLPEVRFTEGLTGYWRLSQPGAGLYAERLPKGAKETLTVLSADMIWNRFAPYHIWLAGGAIVCIPREQGDGAGAFTPDTCAPEGTEAWHLGYMLKVPAGEFVAAALVDKAEGTMLETAFHQGVIGRTITLGPGQVWQWVGPDGNPENITPYVPGDKTIDLRAMVKMGRAVPVASNECSGSMVEVLGLTVYSEVAFNGLEGDPFKFLVPCEPGQSRTMFVAVRHEVGYMVYGFTVAYRSGREAHTKVAHRKTQLLRRPVSYEGPPGRRYFVLSGQRIFRRL